MRLYLADASETGPLESIYKQQQDTIEYAQIVQDPTGLRKISGVLSQDSNYNTVQSIAQIEEIEEPELEGTLKALKAKGSVHSISNPTLCK